MSEAPKEEIKNENMNEMVKNLGSIAYKEFCYRFDIDPEDAQEMSWFIADHYDAPKVISWLMENHNKFDAEEIKNENMNECDTCETKENLFEMTDMAYWSVLCGQCISDGEESHWLIKTHIPETFPIGSKAHSTPRTGDEQ